MKKALRLVKLCLAAVLAVGLVMSARHLLGTWKAAQDHADAERIAGLVPPEPVSAPGSKPEEAQGPDGSAPPIEEGEPLSPEEALAVLDLPALQAVNSEVVGWIQIPDTQLSYPVLRGGDNQYYLTHTWKKAYSPAGAIFQDCRNGAGFDGSHTILYGHRMNDDTMFGTLKYYRKAEFWQAHPSIYLVLEDGVRRYDIFAAYEASVWGIVYEPDLSGREGELIQAGLDNSVFDAGIVPEAEDRILTLSTCTRGKQEVRWVAQARLAEVYERT